MKTIPLATLDEGLAKAVEAQGQHEAIGLTNDAGTVAWVLRELAHPRDIGPGEMLIGGDEFGPIGGFLGSDSRMLLPEVMEATVVSVGPEPGGTPPHVLHLGGGPARFRKLLADQAALYPIELPAACPGCSGSPPSRIGQHNRTS